MVGEALGKCAKWFWFWFRRICNVSQRTVYSQPLVHKSEQLLRTELGSKCNETAHSQAQNILVCSAFLVSWMGLLCGICDASELVRQLWILQMFKSRSALTILKENCGESALQ